MTQTDVVVCCLVVLVADCLIQPLCRIQMRLSELARIFLLAFQCLLKLSGVEQQLTVCGSELLGALALGIKKLPKVLGVEIELRLAGRQLVTLTMHAPRSRRSARRRTRNFRSPPYREQFRLTAAD